MQEFISSLYLDLFIFEPKDCEAKPHSNLFKVNSYMYSKSNKKELYTIQQTTKVTENPQRRLICTKKETTKAPPHHH
jgi:hypothetical protein